MMCSVLLTCSDRLGDARALAVREAPVLVLRRACSGSGTRTRDTAIMSRLLYRLSYPAVVLATSDPVGPTVREVRYSADARWHRSRSPSPHAESNRRPSPYHGDALPAEL